MPSKKSKKSKKTLKSHQSLKLSANQAAPSFPAIPSSRATLVRIETIHRLLLEVTPGSLRRVTLHSLMADLGVARNTVRCDLELMEIFNAPIAYDRARRTLYYTRPYTLR